LRPARSPDPDFVQTAGPMIGVAATALVSLYAGLKGMIG